MKSKSSCNNNADKQCAPGCLISLSGGDASFDALAQGYQTAGTFFASQDAMTYFGILYVRALASMFFMSAVNTVLCHTIV